MAGPVLPAQRTPTTTGTRPVMARVVMAAMVVIVATLVAVAVAADRLQVAEAAPAP